MIYDIYINLSSDIGWSKKKSLSEQLRAEKLELEASAARQRKRDAADRKRLYMLKREKAVKARNPNITIEEMDAAHAAYYKSKTPITEQEIQESLRAAERKRAAAKKRRQLKRKEKNQCINQS